MTRYEYSIVDATAFDYNDTTQSFKLEADDMKTVISHMKENFNPLIHKLTFLYATNGVRESFAPDKLLEAINKELMKS